MAQSYYWPQRWKGRCAEGCGCESLRNGAQPDAGDCLEMIWCRRCEAYTLFRWEPEKQYTVYVER